MREICRWQVPMSNVIGSPCPDCGHTDIVHPGAPAGFDSNINECLICALNNLKEQYEAELSRLREENNGTQPDRNDVVPTDPSG